MEEKKVRIERLYVTKKFLVRQYVKGVFEEEYGQNSVAKVEATQYSPYTIDITVYVRGKVTVQVMDGSLFVVSYVAVRYIEDRRHTLAEGIAFFPSSLNVPCLTTNTPLNGYNATTQKWAIEVKGMKVMWNGREIEIPPKIDELLKKRGWTFPPTDEMVREWREAREHSAGSVHTDPAVVEARWEEDKPGWLRRSYPRKKRI